MSFNKLISIHISGIFLLVLLSNPIKAQQDAQVSQYMFNTMAYNPGYAGYANLLNATILYRAQWVGLEGAPNTQTLTANSPLKNKKLAVGGSLFHDAIGPAQTVGLYGDFAYKYYFPKANFHLV